MGNSVSMVDGRIDRQADCSKCATKCKYKEWFEHEMWVKEHGCKQFKSRGDAE